MPIEVARNIAKRCREGKLSDRMKKLKAKIEGEKGKSLSCTEFGHIVANMVENKRKSEGKGGDVPHKAYAFYQQSAKGGDSPDPEERNPFWMSVMDSTTRLRDDQHGSVNVDDIAMYLAKDNWKGLKGRLDHYPNLEKEINISDTRFDFGNGELFFEVCPDDDEIYNGLKKGEIKPSIEIGYWGKDIDEDDYVTSFNPTALGLMVDGTARGPNVGPRDPPNEALGGDNMAKEDEDGKEPEKEEEEEKDKEEEKKDSSESDDKKKEEEEEQEEEEEEGQDETSDKDIEALKKKLQEQNDRLKEILDNNKKLAGKKKELQDVIINNIVEANKGKYPKEMILNKKDMTVEDVEARVKELDNLAKLINDGYPDDDIPPVVQKPKKDKKFDENGRVTDEYFEKLMETVEPDSKKKDDTFKAPF